MAIEIETATLQLTVIERTYKIEILTPVGEDPQIRVYRERVWQREDGSVVQRDIEIPPVVRRLSAIAAEAFTLPENTCAGLAAAIAQRADDWRAADQGGAS
jgi:hypothetical protein